MAKSDDNRAIGGKGAIELSDEPSPNISAKIPQRVVPRKVAAASSNGVIFENSIPSCDMRNILLMVLQIANQ